ncbi:hypothetical protein L6164_006662 [Bauhinia variegata]|uniref:Uncharacterized protein n=1 Tax=Bauhinia variegata TaxID=167791 RepID=A0ACB9PV47_BAUVA|nr:hypothetical protein L6164_006662 [Bauhinia variegata]
MGILPKCFGFSGSKHTSSSHHMNKYSTQIEELCHRFSLAQLQKSTNNFNDSRKIGRGGFGYVYKACICIQGIAKEIAIKRFSRDSIQAFSEFQNEIELLCQLRHPNLVSLIGFCFEKDEKIIVYEYMANGSLHDHLVNKITVPLPWKRRVEICIGAARGLHYLHSGTKRIIFHRDVKQTNILLDQNWIPKLSDFGLSLIGPLSMSKPKPTTLDRIIGTYGYMAPEYYFNGTFSEKCDVFSFGMVLLVVVCAKDAQKIVPVDEDGSESENSYENLASKVYNLVHEGMADEIVDPFLMGKIAPKCWKVFMDIAERCLLDEPNERPAMGEVEVELEHALALQEEADQTNPSGDYSLLSTVAAPQPENGNQNLRFSADKNNNGADTT